MDLRDPGADLQELDSLDRALLDRYQRDFPLSARPFARVAADLGLSEAEVMARYRRLMAARLIGRIGAVVRPHRAGWSTLAAMAVPEVRLEAVAERVSDHPRVNHNYEREHSFNLWFVVTGADEEEVTQTLAEIEAEAGCPVMELPLVEAYCLDLGFPLSWPDH